MLAAWSAERKVVDSTALLTGKEYQWLKFVRRVYERKQLRSQAEFDANLGLLGKVLPRATPEDRGPAPVEEADYFIQRRFHGVADDAAFYLLYPSGDLTGVSVQKMRGDSVAGNAQTVPVKGFVNDIAAVCIRQELWVFTSELSEADFGKPSSQFSYRCYLVKGNGISSLKDWHAPTDALNAGRLMFAATVEDGRPVVYSFPYLIKVGATVIGERSVVTSAER